MYEMDRKDRFNDHTSLVMRGFMDAIEQSTCFTYYPVFHIGTPRCYRYHVCHPNWEVPDVKVLGSGRLARTLIRACDQFVVSRVIDVLMFDAEAILGCRINPKSCIDDEWWDENLLRLERWPSAARRLVIEVKVGKRGQTPDEFEFSDRLRRAGVQFVLDFSSLD